MTGTAPKPLPPHLQELARQVAHIRRFLQVATEGRVTAKGLKAAHNAAHTLHDLATRADLEPAARIGAHLETTLKDQLERKRGPSKSKIALMKQALCDLKEQIIRSHAGAKESPPAAETFVEALPGPSSRSPATTPLTASQPGNNHSQKQASAARGDEPPQAAEISAEEPEPVAESVCCRFQVDRWDFHLPMQDMVEIAQLPEVIPLPFAPNYIRGLINLRGRVVPVIDLSSVRGTPPADLSACQLVIAQSQEEQLAFLADRMPHLAPEYGGEALDVARFIRQYGVKEN